MRHTPDHAVTDEHVVRRLIAENPWATLVSNPDGELVASHYPVLLDDRDEQLAVVTHVGRPDEELHRFGTGELLLIVAGPHDFEQHVEVPLALDQEFGSRLARGTVGVRLPISRFVCKVKMSQDKDPQSQRHVLEALRRRGPYFNPALADEMERALSAT